MIKRKKYGKKIMSIILAASMTISLAACGGKDNADSKQPAQQESMNTEINTEINTDTSAGAEAETEKTASKNTINGAHDNKELEIARKPAE